MKYHFIKTVERPEGWVAMFVDEDVVGPSGVEAMRSAAKMPNVFNTIRSREGVHFLDRKGIRAMLQKIEKRLEKEQTKQ